MSSATLTRPPTDPQAGPPGHRATADPRWVRPSALGLLAVTAVLYLWNLAASGWANSYYAAAVQAGTQSWKAMFFGSLDAGNVITVDKPPASLWMMEIAGRLFGFNAWTVLAPQALEGVAAVGLLYLTVKRWHGPIAGLLAGAALAVTPVAALMFRFDNPDALLTLLLVASAYTLTRFLDRARTGWLVLTGALIGFAFLTKMLQGFLVLPGFALVVLLAAPSSWWRRVRQMLAGGLGVLAGAGWWVAIVELWPASSRPYIGGSTNNSMLELVLGYNGLSRLTGGSGSPGGGTAGGNAGTAGSSFGGATGLSRLFSSDMAVDVAWLLPAALLALVLLLWTTRRAPRTDRTRAAALLWGSWLIMTGLVFSYMQGTVHPYYTVALAPAVAALVAIGGRETWLRRETWLGRVGLAGLIAAAGGMGFVMLARDASWYPVLRWTVLGLTVISALGVLLTGRSSTGSASARRTTAALVLAGTLAGLAGPAAYSVATAASPHTGSIPTAGPASASTGGMGGGMGGGPGGGTTGGQRPSANQAPSGQAANGQAPGSQAPSGTQMPTQSGSQPSAGGGQQGGATTSSALTALLKATTTRWAAATTGAQSAASLELASGTSVMGIGGFTGSDPAPTLAQFEQYVTAGLVRYFVVSGGGGSGGMGGNSEIASWVTSTFTSTTVGGATVYDLSSATGTTSS
jgi:4-amino-4-deoxy-L-arabinose transferase-like glycosyltransferase